VTLLSQHLESRLDPRACATLESHLAQCSHCRDACDSLKRTLALCRELPTPDVPASLAASIRAAVRSALDQP
jgi:RNA polymerase sigma-70 factor (ECF subfamily)